MGKSLGKNLAIGTAVGGLSSAGLGAGVSALGFTTSGIAKASIAAGIQSSLGTIEAGGLFATAQSLGATGFFLNPATLLVAGGIGAGLGIGYFATKKVINHLKSSKQKQ